MLLALVLPASAGAALRVDASFRPDRLGASTAIKLGFHVGRTPSRLAGVALHLPPEITSGFNTLGLATCDASELEARGPHACPRDSLIGRGLGTVSVPFGLGAVLEPLTVDIFMAPAVKEQTRVLFYVEGSDPVITQLVFEGSMQGDKPPFGTLIEAEVPEIAGIPGSPAPALVSMQTELGPKDLRYTRVEDGKTVSFTPKGFNVPPSCPAGGFPFAAEFSFADGSRRSVSTRAACPRKRDKDRRKRKDVG
ncbi:MAG: hypothetical protein QM729_07100 [Solirubrobacterales bacterium]